MDFKSLFGNFAQPGKVIYIGVRTQQLEPITKLRKVVAIEGKGLEGDRYNNRGGQRQVTLIQAEHLSAIASYLGKKKIDPGLT
jgi:MOSC domain-containing protein YiiM